MTFLKKSLAVLLAVAMMIGSMSIAASAWDPAVDDGKTITFVHEFYRYNEKTGAWDIKTDRAKPGEVVKMRAKVTTDYYTNSSNSALFFDSRFFTILDNAGNKPDEGVNFITNVNNSYLGLGAKDNNSMWYSKNSKNFTFKQTVQASENVNNYLNGELVEVTDSEGNKTTKIPLADFIENYNAVKSTIFFPSSPYNTKLDGSDYLYEYIFEVKDNTDVRTPGNKGTVCLPPEVAANADYAMLFNFPKGPSTGRADTTWYFGFNWTPEIITDQNLATISVFSDVILDANGGSFSIDGDAVATRKVSGVIGDAVTGISTVLPAKEGFVFSGWSLTADGAVLSNEQLAALTHDYEDTTLYAIYGKSDSYYTVELFEMLADGTYSTEPTAKQQVPEVSGKTVNYPAVPQTGFYFDESQANITSITVAEDNSSVIRVYYARKSYQVIYHFEDATGAKTDSIPALYGASIPQFTAVPGGPIKEGAEFKGWSTDKDKLVAVPTSMPAENIELYPIFEPIVYIYVFDADGGKLLNKDNEEVELLTYYYNHGAVPSFPADPVKPGYTFVEWDYELPATVTEDMDFAAVYNQNVYTVKFTDDGVVKYQTTAYYGDEISVDDIPEGYKVNAWTVNDTTTVATFPYEITDNVEFKATDDALVYDAIFNAGEGEFDDGSKSQTVPTLLDEEVVPPANNPTLYGHSFVMWDPMVEGAIMQEGGLTFNAIYEPAEYNVTLYDDDGTTVLKEETVTFGDSLEALQNYKPEKPGYDFVKWSEEIPATMGGEDFEAQAIWNAKTYKIEFYDADGTLVGVVVEKTDAPVKAPDFPVVDGYVYTGWINEKGEGVPATMPVGGDKFTAVREPAEITITLDANGGTLAGDATIVAKFGDAISAPAAPSLEGNEFLGWSTSADGLVVAFPETMPAKDTTYYAIWKTNEHLATFNANGSTFKVNGEAVYSELLEYGETIVFPELNDREGYAFAGWTPNTTTMPNEPVTFTAQWEYIPTGKADYTIYIYTVNPATGEYIETIKTGTTESGNKIEIVADGVTSEADVVIDYEGLNLAESNVPDTDNANNILSITAEELAENKLVAYFELATFTATFDANNGTITAGDAEVSGTWGAALTAPAVSRTGYKFIGWEPTVPSTLTETKTYVAKWEQITAEAIFTIDGVEHSRKTYKYGEEIVPPTAPAKEGYTFTENWGVVNGETMGEKNKTFDGTYTAVDYTVTYTITDNKPGATVPTALSGKHISDMFALAVPATVEGYTFEGWTYNGATYVPGSSFVMPAADVVLTGKYVANTVTVQFDTAGGNHIDSIKAKFDDRITLPEATESSGNKTFLYWTDGANTYAAGIEYAVPAEDVTLTAVWDVIESSVTVDYTGEVPNGVNDYSLGNKEAGSVFALPAFPTAVEGYTFDGWYINDAKYGAGANYTMPNKAVTIIGKWTKNPVEPEIKTYTLTLDATGGKFNNGNAIYTAILEEGKLITTTPGNPKKDGFRFLGWVDENGSVDNIPQNMPANDVTLYAAWAELFDVTYKVDGEVQDNYTNIAAEGDVLPAPSIIPQKEGYVFDKWVDEATNEVVTSMPAKDLVLIATWKEVEPTKFTVMYFDGTTSLGTQQYKAGDTIVPITAEEKVGYTFNGWTGMPADMKMPAEDIAVFADYVAKLYTITLDAANGEFEDGSTQFVATDVAYNTILATLVPAIPAAPTRDGYSFAGWVDANTGVSATIPTTMPDGNISLRATWEEVPTYTLTLDANGGKFADATDEKTIIREEGEAIGALEQPSREGGYTFKEWKIVAPDGTTLNEIPANMPAYDFKLVAQWNEPVPDKFVVTVNPNGGKFSDGTTGTWTSEQLEEGESITNLPGNPTKDGYEFKGWLESTTGNILDNVPSTVPGANTVYTAQWEEIVVKTYKINYYLVKGGALYDSDSYKEGDAISFITPAAKDIEGFDFEKWVDADGNDISSTMGTEDINAYAKLTPKKFTVTYMNEGKVFYEVKDVAYGSAVPKTTDIPTSSSANKEFSGWTDSTGKTPADYATMPAKNLVFEANYKNIATTGEYEATFISDGVIISSKNYKEGDKIDIPAAPNKFGYKFVGWDPAVPDTMPAKDCEFVAQYEIDKTFVSVIIGGTVIGGGAIAGLAGLNATLITGAAIIGGILVIFGASQLAKHTFTVTYMVDGEVYKTYKVVEGTKIPVPAKPVKDGAEFAGWNPEVPEKMPGKDMTFEATWESEIVEIPNTGSVAGVAAFATISAAAAAAYVMTAKKKKED